MKMVSRSQLLDKLNQWAAGELSPVEVHDWAAGLHVPGRGDFEDWEGNGRFSGSKETIEELYMLDMNLVTSDDVPVFAAFLNTPEGEFEKGYITFISELQKIDRKAREKTLKDTEPYVRYCRPL